jgi:choloylglycine hydrolase
MGDCAVIEFLDGKMVHYVKETMPVKVLSNFETYGDLISSLNIYKSWGGDLPAPQSSGPFDRFVRAADMVKNYNPKTSKSASDYAFDVLANVAVVKGVVPTAWSIVFDIKNLHVYYHGLDKKQIKHFALSSFDFSCNTPVKLLDIKTGLIGDITKNFFDYNYKLYRGLLLNTLNLLDNERLDIIANYPQSTVCMDK